MVERIRVANNNSDKTVQFNANAITRLIEKKGDRLILEFFKMPINLFADLKIINHIFAHPNQYLRSPKTIGVYMDIFGSEGLTTIQDENKWKIDREAIQDLITAKKMRENISIITNTISTELNHWEQFAETNKAIQINLLLARITLKNLINTFFKGINIDVNTIIPLGHIMADLSVPIIFYNRVKWFGIIPLPLYFKFKSTLTEFNNIIDNIVKQSLSDNTPDDNLIKHLANTFHYPKYHRMDKQTKYHLHCEAAIFLISGYIGLTEIIESACILISLYPAIANTLFDEIHTHLGFRIPEDKDLNTLLYTNALVKEVLRLYPSVKFIMREAMQDDIVENYKIKKGSLNLIPIATLHKLSKYWENPEVFTPERFLQELSKEQQQLFMPFGRGERSCVAAQFATLQILLTIVLLAQRYRLQLCPGFDLTGEPEADRNILMTIRKI